MQQDPQKIITAFNEHENQYVQWPDHLKSGYLDLAQALIRCRIKYPNLDFRLTPDLRMNADLMPVVKQALTNREFKELEVATVLSAVNYFFGIKAAEERIALKRVLDENSADPAPTAHRPVKQSPATDAATTVAALAAQ